MKEAFDFENIKDKAIGQLKAGKPLLGKDGAFDSVSNSVSETLSLTFSRMSFEIILIVSTTSISSSLSQLTKMTMLTYATVNTFF